MPLVLPRLRPTDGRRTSSTRSAPSGLPVFPRPLQCAPGELLVLRDIFSLSLPLCIAAAVRHRATVTAARRPGAPGLGTGPAGQEAGSLGCLPGLGVGLGRPWPADSGVCPAWAPVWAGQEAGGLRQMPGLETGLGRSGGRPNSKNI